VSKMQGKSSNIYMRAFFEALIRESHENYQGKQAMLELPKGLVTHSKSMQVQ